MPDHQRSAPVEHSKPKRDVCLALSVCALALGLAGCGLRAGTEKAILPSSAAKGEAIPVGDSGLDPAVTQLDFGVVRRATKHERRFWLTNRGKTPVRLAFIETSCDCFQVVLDSKTIEPAIAVRATAVLDLNGDPHFCGRLRLEAAGRTAPTASPSFVVRVDAVVAANENVPKSKN
jgi:hypothetical protein